MTDKELIEYPQYRKYHNSKSYFKIISPMKFEELQAKGNGFAKHVFTAKILPDRNFIYDLTFEYEKYGIAIGEKEYSDIESKVK